MSAPKHRSDRSVEGWLSSMSLEDKVGQMAQIDVRLLFQDTGADGHPTLNQTAIEEWVGIVGVGSILNAVPGSYWTTHQYRHMLIQIQNVAHQYGRPPVLYGIDSVHGGNYFRGAVVTPQPLNIAATFNITVATQAGQLASQQTREAGLTWLFSPLLGLALNPFWSRVYETFGEDPYVVAMHATAMIRGIQEIRDDHDNDDDNTDSHDRSTLRVPSRAAACAKHFVGYSYPRTGHDRAPSWIPTRHLYQYFVPPWQKAIRDANVQTVMESYTETDGVPNVANYDTTHYLLRQRLNFTGVLVTDYNEMENLHTWHKTAPNLIAAVQQSLQKSSVDMSMLPTNFANFMESIHRGIQEGTITEHRITQSAQRILRLKAELHMMNETIEELDETKTSKNIHSSKDEALALEMVRQSIIMVKNDYQTLPLDIETGYRQRSILLTGPTANSLTYQTGGWTGDWQGIRQENQDQWFTYGSTVLDAFQNEPSFQVSYECGVDILGRFCNNTANNIQDVGKPSSMWNDAFDEFKDLVGLKEADETSISRAATAASNADLVIVCLGEETYTEKPGDIRTLELPTGQYALIEGIRQRNPKIKIALVYFGGRPRLLRQVEEMVDAIFIAFLPGPSAGQAIVDIVTGRVNPSGKLPITYPRYDDLGGSPYFHTVSDQCTVGDGILPHWQYSQCPVQWPFGYGLSYTTFEYRELRVSGGIDRDLHISVTVKNVGDRSGSDTVMFFTFDAYRSSTPEYKRLRAFQKVYLKAGEEAQITVTVPLEDLRFIGPNDESHYVIDPTLSSWVGVGVSTDCREDHTNLLCGAIKASNPQRTYSGPCDAACSLWIQSGCLEEIGLTVNTCWSLCVDSTSTIAPTRNEGWGWNYVHCLESVLYEMQEQPDKSCSQMTTLCRDILGSHPAKIASKSEQLWSANYIAGIAGLFSLVIIGFLVYGRPILRSREREVEFVSVSTAER